MIIAVDGPTASGKGTISKQLAKHFPCPFSILACSIARSAGRSGTKAGMRMMLPMRWPPVCLTALYWTIQPSAAKWLVGWPAGSLFIQM
jgi:hypothetical protein